MIRAIALSLALLIGVGVIVPLATDYAEAGAKKTPQIREKEKEDQEIFKKMVALVSGADEAQESFTGSQTRASLAPAQIGENETASRQHIG
jgi:hypothetical protein